jgi:hypothetical protein
VSLGVAVGAAVLNHDQTVVGMNSVSDAVVFFVSIVRDGPTKDHRSESFCVQALVGAPPHMPTQVVVHRRASCPLCGRLRQTAIQSAELDAQAEAMLNVADTVGVNLWALEKCRQRVVAASAQFDLTRRRYPGRARQLRRAVEREMGVLIDAFLRLASAADRGGQQVGR